MTETETLQATVADGGWPDPKDVPGKGDIDKWKRVTGEVRKMAEAKGWSRAAVAKRAGMKPPTFYQVMDGSYPSNVDAFIEQLSGWLLSEDEAERMMPHLPESPAYVETETSRRLADLLLYARLMPTIAVATLGSGMGKTVTCEDFTRKQPHSHLVTMRPMTSSIHAMMVEIGKAIDVDEPNPRNLDRAVGDRLKRNGRKTILIIDEAQNLSHDAVNQLRYLLDSYGVGIALVGNEELYGRYGSATPTPAYAQIHSRIGLRLKRLRSTPGDINAMATAWGVTDPAILKVFRTIANKPGALRQADQSMKMAHMIANSAGRSITAEDLRAAWTNRGGEEL